jgi:dihydrofolate reductase
MTRVSIVVAADEDGGIGLAGGLPWHLPGDLRQFKRLTFGKPVIMGRRTHESIGRPLPGRHNIVVSRQPGLALEGCTVVESLQAALAAAGAVPEACVIGGAQLYRDALPIADLVHLTRVHARVAADTFLPEIDPAEWREVAREDHPADERHAIPYSFLTLERTPR